MAKSPAPAQPSASMLVSTADGTLLAGQRSRQIPFLGSYLSFPGGRVEKSDETLAAELLADDELGVRKIAALRELEEETGLTLSDGRAIPFDASAPFETRAANVDFERFVPAGRWVTPAYAPVRFDTQFFLYVVEAAVEATPSEEFEWMRFESAQTLVEQWKNLEHLLAPPTKVAIEVLAFGTEDAPRRITAFPGARGGDHHEFEPVPDTRMYALRTPTLPPAITTNAVVIGRERFIVVDPATYDDDERDKLLVHLEALVAKGRVPEAVVLTHHHMDHTGSAEWVSEKLGVPIAAHPITKELVALKIEVTRTLEEGDTIDLGLDVRGEPFKLDVWHTPGHAPGHIVLVDRRPGSRWAIVGDMVAAIGTIIVDPYEGDMQEYISQLRRLAAELPENPILVPAHGPPIVQGRQMLDHYVAHRLKREGKVVKALEVKGGGTAKQLLDVAYDDTPVELYPLAAQSCLSHLIKLERDGRAKRDGDRFTLV